MAAENARLAKNCNGKSPPGVARSIARNAVKLTMPMVNEAMIGGEDQPRDGYLDAGEGERTEREHSEDLAGQIDLATLRIGGGIDPPCLRSRLERHAIVALREIAHRGIGEPLPNWIKGPALRKVPR